MGQRRKEARGANNIIVCKQNLLMLGQPKPEFEFEHLSPLAATGTSNMTLHKLASPAHFVLVQICTLQSCSLRMVMAPKCQPGVAYACMPCMCFGFTVANHWFARSRVVRPTPEGSKHSTTDVRIVPIPRVSAAQKGTRVLHRPCTSAMQMVCWQRYWRWLC